jgi:RNA polymerase sigma-70 factor (ECF subfamily)
METLTKGDVEAAYKQVFPMILAKCRRMLVDSSEAHDVAQETFTRLWASRELMRDGTLLTAWLYRTSTRIAVDRLRLRSRQQPTDFAENAIPPALVSSFEERTDARHVLAALWRRAPTKEMEAAILSGVDGLTHPEIAEVMGTSERTVRRLLVRFQERLAKARARS